MSCSTTSSKKDEAQRLAPPVVETDCKAIVDSTISREQFFEALRGSALIAVGKDRFEVDLAALSPHSLRAELSGPLGIRFGMLQVNSDWIQFYNPRERLVKRLPFEEFQRNSARRSAYLEELPLALPDPFIIDALLTRSGLEQDRKTHEGLEKSYCPYIAKHFAYELVYRERLSSPKNWERWHRVWVDATSFYPIRHTTVMAPQSKRSAGQLSRSFWSKAPEWDLVYSLFTGTGVSTLPRKMSVWSRGRLWLSYEWVRAERIQDRSAGVFQWRPAASMEVKDY